MEVKDMSLKEIQERMETIRGDYLCLGIPQIHFLLDLIDYQAKELMYIKLSHPHLVSDNLAKIG